MLNEHCRTHYLDPGRASDYRPVVARETYSLTVGPKGTNHSIGGAGRLQSRYRQVFEHFSSNRSVMARTFFSSSVARFGERCSSSWTFSEDFSKENNGYCQRYPAHNTSPCDPLECAQYGKRSPCQSNDRSTHMARIQSKTSFGRKIQTQSRQKIPRETLRYCRSVPEPAGQRMKKNAGSGLHSSHIYCILSG